MPSYQGAKVLWWTRQSCRVRVGTGQDCPVYDFDFILNERLMELLDLLFSILLIFGVFLFLVGTFFFFVPALLVKWNALGNIWIGNPESAERYARLFRRLFSADYAIFANHRITGGIIWGLSSVFLIVYLLYR